MCHAWNIVFHRFVALYYYDVFDLEQTEEETRLARANLNP